MKRETAKWVLKAEDDIEAARSLAQEARPKRDIVCFHCQQAAEKYLMNKFPKNPINGASVDY